MMGEFPLEHSLFFLVVGGMISFMGWTGFTAYGIPLGGGNNLTGLPGIVVGIALLLFGVPLCLLGLSLFGFWFLYRA
jgi:hypothetical protein